METVILTLPLKHHVATAEHSLRSSITLVINLDEVYTLDASQDGRTESNVNLYCSFTISELHYWHLRQQQAASQCQW